MKTRICYRWSLCLLVAPLAIGCTQLYGFREPDSGAPTEPLRTPLPLGLRGESAFNKANTLNANNASPNNGWRPLPDAIPGGKVIAAGGQAKDPKDPLAPLEPATPAPLPQPRATPTPQNNTQPITFPPASVPGPLSPPSAFTDPHVRSTPTVTGGRLQLAPYEVPTDRVVDLTKQLDLLAAQNNALLLRIKELEMQATGREQSLKEAERDLENLIASAQRERAALQAQIDALQSRIKQMEEEDIQILQLVIEALKKLLERVP